MFQYEPIENHNKKSNVRLKNLRLPVDSAMRQIVGGRAKVASISLMGRFETEILKNTFAFL